MHLLKKHKLIFNDTLSVGSKHFFCPLTITKIVKASSLKINADFSGNVSMRNREILGAGAIPISAVTGPALYGDLLSFFLLTM